MSRLEAELHLYQGNLNLCLIIGISVQCLNFLLPVFINLHPNCRGGGKNFNPLLCPLVLVCLEDICCRLQLPIAFLGQTKRFCSTPEKGKLLNSSMFLFFAKGRIHTVTEITGGVLVV